MINKNISTSYSSGAMPWGAFPGNSIKNIETGNCYVFNARMYHNIEKGTEPQIFLLPRQFKKKD